MNRYLYIGIDLGTTYIKGVLVDDSKCIIASGKREMVYIEQPDGFMEVDPEYLFKIVCDLLKEFSILAINIGKIKAICFSGATGNTLLLDDNNTPLTNIISWLDTRPVQTSFTTDEVYPITGWPRVENFPLAHLSWLKNNSTETYRKAKHIVMNNDYLIFRLTGQFVLDYSTASTFHLFNQVERVWHKPFLDKLNISEGQLSIPVPTGSEIGTLLPKLEKKTGLSSDTMVVAGSFDHPAAARAVNVLNEGELLFSCGTSWVGFYPHMNRKAALKQKGIIDPFLSQDGGPWGVLLSISKLGLKIDSWITKISELFKIPLEEKFQFFNNEANKSLKGVNDVGINLLDSNEFEILDQKPVGNIARAIMENAAFLLKEKIEQIKLSGIIPKHIIMVGGPTNSTIWPNIISDIIEIEIMIKEGEFAGALGAAKISIESFQFSKRNAY
jgi:sugar (pentulose or hexulose) kinase